MFKLALKNLLRYKKRTFITAFAVAVGITIGIFSSSFLNGLDLESDRNMIWFETSNAKIFEQKWFNEKHFYPIDYLINQEKAEIIEQGLIENNIKNYTKEFIEPAEVIFYEDPFEATGSIKGLIHALDTSTSSAYQYEKGELQGEWIKEGSQGVVVGYKAAEDMKAEIGYYLTLQCKGKGGFMQAFDVPIIGIINTGNPVIDRSALFFDYNYINEILELDNSYSSIAISIDNSLNYRALNKVMPIFQEIASQASLNTYDWKEIENELVALQKSKNGSSVIIMFFLFVIAIVGVTNTMLMAITERKNEIAMLRTLGYKNSYIKALFTIEGGLIGVIGAVIGAIIGLLLSSYFQYNGIDFSSFATDIDLGYRINMVMYAVIDTNKVIQICLMGIFFSILAAFMAVRKSIKGEIAEEFRSI